MRHRGKSDVRGEYAPGALYNLIRARKERNLAQHEACKIVGKNQSHYGKIELGKVEFSAREALELCRAFNLTLEELLATRPERKD
jgi:transcriptional regulator with XRE-family HTH domain